METVQHKEPSPLQFATVILSVNTAAEFWRNVLLKMRLMASRKWGDCGVKGTISTSGVALNLGYHGSSILDTNFI